MSVTRGHIGEGRGMSVTRGHRELFRAPVGLHNIVPGPHALTGGPASTAALRRVIMVWHDLSSQHSGFLKCSF